MIDAGPAVVRVCVPDRWLPERAYVADQILGDWLGLGVEIAVHDRDEVRLERADVAGLPALTMPDILFAHPDGRWSGQPPAPLRPAPRHAAPEGILLPGCRVPDPVPVPYAATAADGPAWTRRGDTIALRGDLLGSVFALLTRLEERGTGPRDAHDRFPAPASWIVAEGVAERPVADDMVDLLWLAMRTAWPDLARRAERFELLPTHDVDQPWSALGRRPAAVARSIGADLLVRREPLLAARRARAALDARRGRTDRDPVASFGFLAETSERVGLRSTFYFQAGTTPADEDFRYRLSDRVFEPLLRDLHGRGHAIGLHGSYSSYASGERLRREADALRAARTVAGVGEDEPLGGRQHFLRFRNPDTWRGLAAAGVAHDSTIGFADRAGFRSGTCREHTVFDLEARRPLPLRERPLAVMDVSLLGYQGLGWPAASEVAARVVGEARRRDGMAVLLVHNNTVAGSRARGHYRELMEGLAP